MDALLSLLLELAELALSLAARRIERRNEGE
jgi:hypothetical protein